MTEHELRQLITAEEKHNIERKESFTTTENVCENICAFANNLSGDGKSGYFIIGVTDSGSICGTNVTDELLLKLADCRSNGNLLPQPSITVDKITVDDKNIAIIKVTPSLLPPVRYKGRIWVRIGPSCRVANEHDERILTERRLANTIHFDACPCREATLDDLSSLEFTAYRQSAVDSEVIEQNHRPLEQQLASLRLYHSGLHVPTNAGLLLLAPDPRQWMFGAYIQFLRFATEDQSDLPIMEKEIGGNLLTMLRQMDELVSLNIQTAPVPASALKEKTYADYPQVALRELLLNAVMHRDYQSSRPIQFYWFSDRIEIHNPGGLYGESVENFPHNSAYRNPVVAEILKNLGYVNRFGYGIARAQKILKENGNPPPEFNPQLRAFGVIIRRNT